ncbi:ABC transporter transmembrane domain-containing protein [Variovorax sp. J22G21]|uniref:ABC transporter transmembrane domain-containing protein n=1 Tax=Variovorax fucosicus TaxID=3053517 RepID=UPI00257713A5|nr:MULTISPECIES: ABC transporter transmembrane domain-containing protein [unclassified Variovorax]MDM0042285.1 ABC transporter transmembrane domain-containing protein [Variovorax sp. J22R193]MDM0060889.1 ABC transporter transmembrane domain-containing protein [Variovorax sp. J22G21]
MADTAASSSPAKGSPQSLSGLSPFLRPYRLQIALAALFLVLAAVTTLLFPLALRSLIDGGLVSTDKGAQTMALREHFLALFGVAVALGLFSAARFYTVSWLGERVTANLRNAVYAHVLRQSPAFFETTQTGEVLSRLTADTTLVQTVVGSSLSMGLRNAVMGVGALAMLVWTNPYVMTQVLLILVLVVLPSMWFGRRVRKLSRASQDRVADSSAIAAEVLNAIPVVQSYTAEGRESARFDASTQQAFQTAVRRTKARSVLVAFIIIATSAALLWGLYQGTQAVLRGDITAGHLGQTVVYVIILASAAAVLGEVYGDLLRAAGATERLMELLHAQSAIVSPSNPAAASVPPAGSAIHLEAITFHYPSRPLTPALRDFSLQVAPGETVALVGSSGAGKSTVFQLLLRYYDPQSGRILLDGTPLASLSLEQLRNRIGLVPQDAVIFSTSALENIRYGRPEATDAEVHEAARAAFADDFLKALPEGYGTFLGERGVRLSGGQRQRIAIARAMLKNPPLLLLDEATSALDAESERMVQAALESAMEGRTTLVIAHRLATVQKANRIIVLDHGGIVEQGTHAALVAQGGVYARLAALQFAA